MEFEIAAAVGEKYSSQNPLLVLLPTRLQMLAGVGLSGHGQGLAVAVARAFNVVQCSSHFISSRTKDNKIYVSGSWDNIALIIPLRQLSSLRMTITTTTTKKSIIILKVQSLQYLYTWYLD